MLIMIGNGKEEWKSHIIHFMYYDLAIRKSLMPSKNRVMARTKKALVCPGILTRSALTESHSSTTCEER